MSESNAAKRITMLEKVTVGENSSWYSFLITNGENVWLEYKDKINTQSVVIFTDKKIVVIEGQSPMGTFITKLVDKKGEGIKKEWIILPHSKCTAFSVESLGISDFNSEFKVWASAIGCIELNFRPNVDVREIAYFLVNKIG